jgi:hypothetical protein
MKKYIFIFLIFSFQAAWAQKTKVLFDASKAQMAGNADWVVDADSYNLRSQGGKMISGKSGEANPQRKPSPASSGISKSTKEDYWKGALSAWAVELAKNNCEIESLPFDGKISYGDRSNPQDLSNYQLFIVCEPNIRFTASEQTALIEFVKKGGSLFAIGDHAESDRNNDGCDSPCVWNEWFNAYKNPFGITFASDKINETSRKTANDSNLINGKAGKVNSVKFSGGASLNLNTSKNSSVKGVVYSRKSEVGSSSGAFCAYATYQSGRIVVLGDSSPADDGTGDSQDKLYYGWDEEDHAKLIMNASFWLLKK